jgi:hypothetical protein
VPPGHQRSWSGRSELGGRLTSPDGTPIAGAVVTALGPGDRAAGTATSAADGSFALADLAPGDYAVTIAGPGVVAETVPNVTVLDKLRTPLDRELCRVAP